MTFLAETVISGLLTGVMYSLVAIGFVLIYKASGVFNFAQGTMVFFAALTFVVLKEHGLPFWAAFPITVLVMIVGAVLIERLVLRPLVNRSPNTLFNGDPGAQLRHRGARAIPVRFGRTPARLGHRRYAARPLWPANQRV